MPKNSSLKGFLPSITFAMALRKKRVPGANPKNLTPQSATTLFGRGNKNPELLLVGESSSEAATLLLNKMIEAMGVKVSDVFVAEVHAQATLTKAQMDLHAPKLIVALGEGPVATLLGGERPLSALRGQVLSWQGYPVIASLSPEFLIKNPSAKKEAWEDLKIAMKYLGWRK